MEKYKNKYRIESTRLQCWDYGWNSAYFITICTAHRHNYFGNVVDEIMNLSDIGCLAWQYWYKMADQYSLVKLDEFIVMPNHVHMIVIIDKPDDGREATMRQIDNTRKDAIHCISKDTINRGDAMNGISTGGEKTNHRGGFAGEKNPMLHDNVSQVVRWYKGVIKFYARKMKSNFEWQRGFYDHIIRTDEAHEKIADYIADNPRRWNDDRYFGSS